MNLTALIGGLTGAALVLLPGPWGLAVFLGTPALLITAGAARGILSGLRTARRVRANPTHRLDT